VRRKFDNQIHTKPVTNSEKKVCSILGNCKNVYTPVLLYFLSPLIFLTKILAVGCFVKVPLSKSKKEKLLVKVFYVLNSSLRAARPAAILYA